MSWPRTRSGALLPPLLLLSVVLHEVCTAVLHSGPTHQEPALRVQRRIHPGRPPDHLLASRVQPNKPSSAPSRLPQMCIVKVLSGSSDNLGPLTEGALSGRATPTSPSISGGSWQGRRASGPLVPAIDGSGMVEVVDPHAILMPGLYETWLVRGAGGMAEAGSDGAGQCDTATVETLAHPDCPAQAVRNAIHQGPSLQAAEAGSDLFILRTFAPIRQVCEYCDRGSLSDLLSGGKLNQMAQATSQSSDPTTQAAHRDAWLLLCLLDIAQGLDYLHEATIVHGDLKVGGHTWACVAGMLAGCAPVGSHHHSGSWGPWITTGHPTAG